MNPKKVCEHTDIEDYQCLQCGADLTEALMFEALERASAHDSERTAS